MSTHIAHGYRLRTVTVSQLHTIIQPFQSRIEAWAQEAYQRQASFLAYRILDLARIRPTWETFETSVRNLYATAPLHDLSATELRAVVSEIIATHHVRIAREHTRDPAYDWGCSLQLLPHPTGLYVLLNAEPPAYHRFWAAHPGVEEYAYHAPGEAPSDISPRRWKRRGLRWADVLAHGSPGLTIQIYDPLTAYFPQPWTMTPTVAPDWSRRIRHWAFEHAVQQYADQHPAIQGYDAVFTVEAWIQTPEAADAWAQLQIPIASILPTQYHPAFSAHTLSSIWTSRDTYPIYGGQHP